MEIIKLKLCHQDWSKSNRLFVYILHSLINLFKEINFRADQIMWANLIKINKENIFIASYWFKYLFLIILACVLQKEFMEGGDRFC